MIFVDSGAWFSSAVPTDRHHAVATRWLAANRQPSVTTDYIVDETLTLLVARGQPHFARAVGQQLFDGDLATIYYLTREDVLDAWDAFRRYSDKGWSFTDCTGKVVMEKLGVTQAFSFDDDFRQFGSVTVVP